MDYRTAAALSQNIAGIGDMFMQMNDPAARAKAALVGNQNALLASQVEGQGIENRYAPQFQQSRIDMNAANAGQSNAAALFHNAQRAGVEQVNGVRGLQINELPSAQGGGLDSLNDAFNAAGAAHGIDPRALKAMSMLETGNGTSSAFLTKKNAMGVSDANGPISFNDPVESINRMARVLSDPNGPYKGKRTLAEIGGVYAPPGAGNDPNGTNGGWGSGVSNFYRQLGGDPSAAIFGDGSLPAQDPRLVLGRQIALQEIVAPGHGQDVAKAAASTAGLFARTSDDMDRSYAGQGVQPFNTINSANNTNNLDQERLRQGGAMDRTLVENDNKARIAILNAGVGSGSDGGGNGLAPKSFSDAKSAAEMASEISKQAFGVSEKDGQLVDDIYNPQRSAYAQSVNNLLLDGHTPMEAKAKADAHHFGGAPAVSTEDGMLSDPSSNFKTAEPIPRQTGAVGGSRMDNVLSLGQQLFGGGEQAAAAPPAAVQTVSTSPAAVPQTGVEKPPGKQLGAADAMKKQQVESDEGTAYNVATLKEILPLAQAKGVSVEDMMATLFANSPTEDAAIKTALANSRYGIFPDRIRNALKDSRALSAVGLSPTISQPYTQQPAPQGGVRRYNPATGTIE